MSEKSEHKDEPVQNAILLKSANDVASLNKRLVNGWRVTHCAAFGDGGALVIVEKNLTVKARDQMRDESAKIEAAMAIRDALSG